MSRNRLDLERWEPDSYCPKGFLCGRRLIKYRYPKYGCSRLWKNAHFVLTKIFCFCVDLRSDNDILLPEGLFVWATLKYRCPSCRRRRTDFWEFCHCAEAPVTRFLGGTVKASAKSWNLGIVHFFHLPWRSVPHDVSKTHFFASKVHD